MSQSHMGNQFGNLVIQRLMNYAPLMIEISIRIRISSVLTQTGFRYLVFANEPAEPLLYRTVKL